MMILLLLLVLLFLLPGTGLRSKMTVSKRLSLITEFGRDLMNLNKKKKVVHVLILHRQAGKYNAFKRGGCCRLI